MTSAWNSRSRFACQVLFAILGLACVPAVKAQYGASPSQTGMFFDDLRSRQRKEREASEAAGVRTGDTVYDYERGMYVGTEESAMGTRDAALEQAREVARPSVRSGSAAYAARSVGDYTNYAGQYASPTGFFAPTYVSDPFLAGRRNLKVGPVNIGFGFNQSVEYNDNVNRGNVDDPATPLVDEGPIGDVISSTLLNIDANYAITQNNRLSLTTALGFDHYFMHPELAPYGDEGFVVNVLPGTTLAFDIKAGPVFITIYDRLAVRPATQNSFALSPNQVFGVFQNDAGIAANWRVNSDWALAANFMHSNANSLQSQFEQFSRTTDSLHGSLTYSPGGRWTLGLEGGSTLVSYPGDFNELDVFSNKGALNNDAVLNNVGLFFAMPVFSTTQVRLAAGYQDFEFDEPPLTSTGGLPRSPTGQPMTTEDYSDYGGLYYSVTISNQLSSRVSQSLSLGREAALNLTSNYIVADFINYGVSFIAWKGSRISVSGYYEDAEMSGGVYADEVIQYGGDLHIAHRLSSRMSVGVGYHYGYTDTDPEPRTINTGTWTLPPVPGNPNRSYLQHAFNADVNYALSPKANLILGYRFFTTEADLIAGSFDQNRLILAFNYNF